MKKLFALIILPIVLLAITNDAYSEMSLKKLIKNIEKTGATVISGVFMSDEQTYKEVLEVQYAYVKEEEKKIIEDINIAKNTCKIMGFREILGRKEFSKCVLQVWQTRLIGKKYKMMQKELEQQNEVFAKQKSAFDSQEISFNQFRDEQMAKNISYNEDYEELKLKGKITRIDYRKVVKYAIGIAAAYYMGKVIGEAIQKRAEEKGVSEAAKSVAGSKSSTLCRYGKVLWSRGNPTAARRYLGKC